MKIGDKVKVLNSYLEPKFIGKVGIIVCRNENRPNGIPGVVFKQLGIGHDLDGHCDGDNGWYISERYLKIVGYKKETPRESVMF